MIPANATLIATPTARFIRRFGGTTNLDEGGFPLVTTNGTQPNIRIEGGLWNGVPFYDLPDDNAEPWIADMTFTAGTGATGKIGFTDAKRKFFRSDDSARDVLQQIWVYQKDANGDFDPTVINNNQLFKVTGFDGVNRITVEAIGGVVTAGTVTAMTGSYVPFAGKVFSIDSPGGVIDGVGLVMPRGIQFLLQGDGFLLTRSWSRNPPPDAGGGVRFARGRGMRGTLLDLESLDDCFQFNPADKKDGDTTGATVEQSSYVECIGRTYQGALVAFINRDGRAYIPDPDGGPSKDSLTSLRDCLARNIRGFTGGSALHGGVAVKVYCANSSRKLANCWAEDLFVHQSDSTPPDTLRAGFMVVTGRPGGGVMNSGARNVVIENRSGPLLAIGPADSAPAGFSKSVEFTLEQVDAPGKGSQPGLPLIGAPYADRLVLRDITGDLSGSAVTGDTPGRALEIGVSLNYVSSGTPVTIAAGTVKELVIDGLATGNAALPTVSAVGKTQGIWRLGNLGKASIRRLSTTLAANASPVGGIEMVLASGDPGATYSRFAEVDFAKTAPGYEIVSWQPQVGNEIAQSIGFDDRNEKVTLASGTTVVAPQRFAPTVTLALGSGVGSATLTSMTPPGLAAPRCTLIVPASVTIANTGVSSGAFQMGTNLPGSATASITFQWIVATSRWREVARTV